MGAEEKSGSINKILYRIELIMLKVLPFAMALIYFCNTLLSFGGIDLPILSYIAGMSVLPLLFMYISSYTFNFCSYHRLPLHYILVNIILCALDFYIGIPVSTLVLLSIHMIIFGVCLFVIIYLYVKSNKKAFTRKSK